LPEPALFGIKQQPTLAAGEQGFFRQAQKTGGTPAKPFPQKGWLPAMTTHQFLPKQGEYQAMARQAPRALIHGQELFFRIQGLVVNRHGADNALGQGLDQGPSVTGTPKGGNQFPALIRQLQSTTVADQVPPADAGQGVLGLVLAQ
jgi:hypothetical protein